ncbi:transcriptional regulator GcvA [Burkholderia sp. MSMB1835]|uniref:transcriptional regulator GcvA n=1 Tax=Burkholderia sp. MSMB1835 TaxID=1637876 RepID=UPI000753DCCD|nr:transcriptional regulator GcvA [Burkholderia sp. MSMB1835]KVL40956.1 LysR family transcriptional regulator [Burkholderia sp. MSMB1835]
MNENRGAAKHRDELPPLNALRAFDAVARHGSFAGAAVELHVTHWAVGKQIRLLEDWFGLPLFDRRPRGVVLTDEGAALLNDVSHAFERLGTAVVRLRHNPFAHRISGVVRVNVPMSFALCWLLPRLADFHSRYPDIDVRVSTTSRKLRYVADAFDIGVRSGPEHGAGVVSRPLMPDLRIPACNPALLRQHPIQSATDLRHHTLLHSATTRSAWSHWLKEAGASDLRAARHVEFDHVNLQLGAAVEGLGVALASLPLIARDLAEGRLVCPIASPVWRADDYMLVTNADRADDAAVSAFDAWMEGMANQEGASASPLLA